MLNFRQFILIATLFAMTFICYPKVGHADELNEAKAFFEVYVQKEKNFDSSIAEMYADEAKIVNTRHYPGGEKRELVFPVPKYKALIKMAMPLAKARGDTSKYTNIEYKKIDLSDVPAAFKISMTRHSNLKNYDSPFSMLVVKDTAGNWKIYEEISESQP